MTLEEGIDPGGPNGPRRGERGTRAGRPGARQASDARAGHERAQAAAARRLAECAHASALEPNGRLVIEHVRRVAEGVPPFARRVAWLHDALEWTGLGEDDLESAGLDGEEVAAVRLLTREDGGADDRTFLAHVHVIAGAPGRAGRIARAVKRIDMADRSRHPRDPGAAWIPPYERALVLLAPDVRVSEGAANAALDDCARRG